MVLGRYLIFGYLDPYGEEHAQVEQMVTYIAHDINPASLTKAPYYPTS